MLHYVHQPVTNLVFSAGGFIRAFYWKQLPSAAAAPTAATAAAAAAAATRAKTDESSVNEPKQQLQKVIGCKPKQWAERQ